MTKGRFTLALTASLALLSPQLLNAENSNAASDSQQSLQDEILLRDLFLTLEQRLENLETEDAGETPWESWSKGTNIRGLLSLRNIRNNLLENNIHDPHLSYHGYEDVWCNNHRAQKYRSADGTCNDVNNPHAGAANVAFGRNVPPEFIVKEEDRNVMYPNPKLVSEVFFTRDEFKPVPFLNMLAASWIQFMNHDWFSHGRNVEENPFLVKNEKGEVVAEIERTQTTDNLAQDKEKEFEFDEEYGRVSLNRVTHWWDGSQIYGSNREEQESLRTFERGQMKLIDVNGKSLLPTTELDTENNKQNMGLELTGFRDNWWVGLSMLHLLFVKEHNAIAEALYDRYVVGYNEKRNLYKWRNPPSDRNDDFAVARWMGKAADAILPTYSYFAPEVLDEHIFQTARLINAAVMAKIHTVEWTPAILANDITRLALRVNWYGLAHPRTTEIIHRLTGRNIRLVTSERFLSRLLAPVSKIIDGYVIQGIVGNKVQDTKKPFNITEEFTSVYRLHSLLPETIDLRTRENAEIVTQVPFDETRNEKSQGLMENNALEDLFFSFGVQNPGQITLNNFPKFMQNLEIPGLDHPMDLGLVDVLRDRERGVPRYNQFRRALDLRPITSYRDFFPPGDLDERQKNIIKNFERVYGEDQEKGVELIDLLVGTLAEEVRPDGFGFGETQFQIFILMASRRLMADRFFTKNFQSHYYTRLGIQWVANEGYLHRVILRHMPELAPYLAHLDKSDKTAFYPWSTKEEAKRAAREVVEAESKKEAEAEKEEEEKKRGIFSRIWPF